MNDEVLASDTLFANAESVTEPGRMEVQRPIRVVPFADVTPASRRVRFPDESEMLRRLQMMARAD